MTEARARVDIALPNVEIKQFTPLPPPPGVCQVCAYDHPAEQPHNLQKPYYQVSFHLKHGRFPTWADAMAHCDEEMQAAWKKELAVLGVIV